jgi:hypothetical protein
LNPGYAPSASVAFVCFGGIRDHDEHGSATAYQQGLRTLARGPMKHPAHLIMRIPCQRRCHRSKKIVSH